MVVGLRDRVDRDLAAEFTTVGATHVVAISGWNIAIVAAMLGALAGRVARRRRAGAARPATLPIVALEFGRLSIVSPIVGLGVVPLVAPAMAAGAIALVAGA